MAWDESGRPDQRYGNHGPGAKLNIISLVGVVLGFFLVGNRLSFRWKKGIPGIDDVLIVLSWLCFLGLGIITWIAVDYGYGRNQTTLTRQEGSDTIRMFYFYQIFYKLTLNLSKLSILTLYLRVFDTKDWFGKITKIVIIIVTTFTLSILVANVLICNPINFYWNTAAPTDPSRTGGRCITVLYYWYASSLYNILSETIMLISILVRIWTLPTNQHPPILQFRQKINLTVVLGLGVFTVITAILRMTTLDQAITAMDKTGGSLVSTIWSHIEAVLALTVGNLPMLRQLLKWRGWFGGRWFGSYSENKGSFSRSGCRRSHGYLTAGDQSLTGSARDGSHPLPVYVHGIQIQREFEREVFMQSEEGEYDAKSRQSSDLEAQSAAELKSRDGCPSPGRKKSDKGALITTTEVRAGSQTSSITSMLRCPPPVEPMVVVRTCTEPVKISTSTHDLSGEMQPTVLANTRGY